MSFLDGNLRFSLNHGDAFKPASFFLSNRRRKMNLNERSTSAATPDLSRLYLISGRIMFDDDDQAYPVEADSR